MHPANRGGHPVYAPQSAMPNQATNRSMLVQAPSLAPPVPIRVSSYAARFSTAHIANLTPAQQFLSVQGNSSYAGNTPLPNLAGRGSMPPPRNQATVQATYSNPFLEAMTSHSVQPYPVAGRIIQQKVKPDTNTEPQREWSARTWSS